MSMLRDVSNTRYRETVHSCKCGYLLVSWASLSVKDQRSFSATCNSPLVSVEHGAPRTVTVSPEATTIIEGRASSFTSEVRDRKSTRLNSSHRTISYAVF